MVLAVSVLACGAPGCRSARRQAVPEKPYSKTSRQYLYVISRDASFVRLDARTLASAGGGSLREAGIFEVEGLVTDPEHRDLVVETSRPWSAEAAGPTPGLVILRSASEGTSSPKMQAIHSIAPPDGTDQLLGAVLTGSKQRWLVASWAGASEEKTVQATVATAEDSGFRDARRLDNFTVGPGTCVASNGSSLYTLSGTTTLEIRALSLGDLKVRETAVPPADLQGFAPLAIRAAGASCHILLVGHSDKQKEEITVPAVIYDAESNGVVSKLTFHARGDYFLSDDGTLAVIDEKTIVPNLLPNGQTIGVRYKKTGVVRVYDAAKAVELWRIKLPEDGRLSSVIGTTGYYISPSLLSVIDLRSGTTTNSVRLPFATGFVAFHRED